MQYDIDLEELANRLEREGETSAAQALRAIAAVRRWDKRHPAQERMPAFAEQVQAFVQQLDGPNGQAALSPGT